MIAALYVQPGGVYYDPALTDVDPWDEERDARKYAGPWPVVAHPPCKRWSMLAPLVEHLYGYKRGDDGGCFEAALRSVREFGGVLEHPASSKAWPRFDLPKPVRGRWLRWLTDPGWVTEVSQVAYGHPARKRTWLYYIGDDPPDLDWSEPAPSAIVGFFGVRQEGTRVAPTGLRRLRPKEGSSTPLPFRDALLSMARTARAPGGTHG